MPTRSPVLEFLPASLCLAWLAACSTDPAEREAADAVGVYQLSDPPEYWFELELLPSGAFLTCERRAGFALPWSKASGTWSVVGDAVVTEESFVPHDNVPRLLLRRRSGVLYLVEPDLEDRFTRHARGRELCFEKVPRRID